MRTTSQGAGLPRRRILTGLGAAGTGLALSACSVPEAPRRKAPQADPLPGKPISTGHGRLVMQILAHPDDDLYFMNPDTQRMLDDGTSLVCVYTTGGEHTGVNRPPGGPTPPPDKGAYSSARHQGLRQAYATLLGLDRFAPWQKGVTTLRGGHRAEINTLAKGGRKVELIFLNTAMHLSFGRLGLPTLWQSRGLNLRTVVAEGSPLQKAQAYDYDELVDALTGLMAAYRPTVIHTLDPDPDIQHSPEAVRIRDSEQIGYSDHADHTATASFSWAAMIRWVAEATRDGGDVPAFVTTAFRGYYNRHWPKNLPRPVMLQKAAHLVPYGGSPSWQCGNPGGCGDYAVGGTAPVRNKKGWVRSTHYRYPGPRPALAADPDGRLVAYGVLGLRAVRWRETSPGSGQWSAPDDLGGGPLAPVLGATALADGRQLLFGLRFDALAGHGSRNTREIVVLQQRTPGGEFTPWTGLGNPEPTPDRGRRLGVPVAVTAPDGQVHLFVRNADQGISTRIRSAAGQWSPWRSLGGGEIQDGLSATVDTAGRVHVYAAGRDTVHEWTQSAPGQPLTPSLTGLPVPGDSPVALPAPDGTVDLIMRRPATSKLTVMGRPTGPALLGKDNRGRDQLLLNGRVLTRPGGAVALEGPALHTGPKGVSVVGLGPDARPWLWRPARSI
ncbi:PIG-L family deacetylase [Streptomyces sp. NBC_01465]|uniref:PIG-L family deacetylase n=1 Tax=Streptomyces sp. NBC_01465 TaxID=2903878 RepID=UPI003FCD9769